MKDGLLKDRMAKKIFADEEGKEYAVEIISEVLKIDKEEILNNIVMMHPNIGVNSNIVDSESDLVYKYNENYINIEINYSSGDRLRIKNNSYLCQLYLRDIKLSDDYLNRVGKKIIQINIDRYDYFGKGDFLYKSTMRDVKYNIEEKDFVEIYHINLEKLASMGYNEITKDRLKMILYMFVCPDKELLEKIYKGDELMAKILNISKQLEESFDELLYYNKEELERRDREDAIKEGLEQGIEQGIKQGIEQGIEQAQIEIINNMLKKGLTKEEICSYINISLKEIDILLKNKN